MKYLISTFSKVNTIGIILFLGLTISSNKTIAQSGTTQGTEFWLMFNTNFSTPQLKIFITSQVNTSGTLTGPGIGTINFSLTANVATQISIPDSFHAHSNGVINNKGLHLVTNDPVSVYGLNAANTASDALIFFPVNSYSRDYMVFSYQNVGYINALQLGIIASENNTNITITPTANTPGRPAGVPYTITMDKGQVVQYVSADAAGDFSGTIITSSKPIAVFTGHSCGSIPTRRERACDVLSAQVPPSSTFGKTFGVLPITNRTGGDLIKFVALQNNTTIKINGVAENPINKGQVFTKMLPSTSQWFVESDKPISVAQFSTGYTFDYSKGDPGMGILAPIEQSLNSYTLTTINSSFDQFHIHLVIPTKAKNSLKINGTPISGNLFTQLGNSQFSGYKLPVSNGTHKLEAPISFGAFMVSLSLNESYLFNGGHRFMPISDVLKLKLDGDTSTKLVNTNKCFQATVTGTNDTVIPGVNVTFLIWGANETIFGEGMTDSNGIATFCYSGVNEGIDSIGAYIGTVSDNLKTAWTSCFNPEITECPSDFNLFNTEISCDSILAYSFSATGQPNPLISFEVSGDSEGSGDGSGSGFTFSPGKSIVTISAKTGDKCKVEKCIFEVELKDTIKPTVITQNITRTLADGKVEITVEDINNGSFDNCSIDTLYLSQISFSCEDIGEQEVILTAIDGSGNISTGIAIVTIEGVSPFVSIGPNPALICKGDAIELTAVATDSGSFSWSNGGDTDIIKVNVEGTYSVEFTNKYGCIATSSQEVIEHASPIANAGSNITLYYGYAPTETDTLFGSADGGTAPYNYYWSNGKETQAIIIRPTETQYYTLTVIDSNGCMGIDVVTVTVIDVRCGTVIEDCCDKDNKDNENDKEKEEKDKKCNDKKGKEKSNKKKAFIDFNTELSKYLVFTNIEHSLGLTNSENTTRYNSLNVYSNGKGGDKKSDKKEDEKKSNGKKDEKKQDDKSDDKKKEESKSTEKCFKSETAWGAGTRYVTKGNWATYSTYKENSTVKLFAGQTIDAGTIHFSKANKGKVTITITLNNGFRLAHNGNSIVSEAVKVQGYSSTPAAKNPAPGQFKSYKGTSLTFTVDEAKFYGIHLDIDVPVECEKNDNKSDDNKSDNKKEEKSEDKKDDKKKDDKCDNKKSDSKKSDKCEDKKKNESKNTDKCFKSETAWGAGTRYVSKGNWATYSTYKENSTIKLFAGQTIDAGSIHFSKANKGKVIITITLNNGFRLAHNGNSIVSEAVKVQGYSSTPAANNPAPGQFKSYKGTSLTFTVDCAKFFGIHLDIDVPVECEKECDCVNENRKVILCRTTNDANNPTEEICLVENKVADYLKKDGYTLGPCASSNGDPIEIDSVPTIKVSPNPVTSQSAVTFNIPDDDYVTIKLYDRNMQVIATIYSGSAVAGNNYTIALNYSNFSYAGTYYIRLETSNHSVGLTLLRE